MSNKSFSIGIIDYQCANLGSLISCFKSLGHEPEILNSPKECDLYILPGVGNSETATKELEKSGLVSFLNSEVLEKKKPVMGICLGFHLMFEKSDEFENSVGFGWLKGHVRKLNNKDTFKLPHVGWNKVHFKNESSLDDHFYFDHTYVAETIEKIAGKAEYTETFPAFIQRDNIWGFQFHPEKSHEAGLNLLKVFLKEISDA